MLVQNYCNKINLKQCWINYEISQPLDENTDPDDMNCVDMTTSEDNNQDHGVNKTMGLKYSEFLQKALDKLRDKFTDVTLPKNESQWQQLFEKTALKSSEGSTPYEEHLCK